MVPRHGCLPRNDSAAPSSVAELFRENEIFQKSAADTLGISSWRTRADHFQCIPPAEVPPIRRGSDRIRGGTNLFRGSPPSPRRIPRRNFLFRGEIEFGGLRRRPPRTCSDPGGPRRSPRRNSSAMGIAESARIRADSRAANPRRKFFRRANSPKLIKIMSGFKQTVSGNRSPSFFRSKMLFGVLRRCL